MSTAMKSGKSDAQARSLGQRCGREQPARGKQAQALARATSEGAVLTVVTPAKHHFYDLRSPWPEPQPTASALVIAALAEEDDDDDGGMSDSTEDPQGHQCGERRAVRNAELRRIVGERFTLAREMNGLNQVEAAERVLGYANSTQLSLIEQGKRQPPLDLIIRASTAYSTSVDYLVGLVDEPEGDAQLAVKAGMFRRLQRLIEFNVAAVTDALVRTCEAPTANELQITRFASRAASLVEAVARFERANPDAFIDMPCGALLQRCANELRATLDQVDRFIRRAVRSRPTAFHHAAQVTAARATQWHPSPSHTDGELA